MYFLFPFFIFDSSRTKLGMNVPWAILHRTDLGIFDQQINIAAVTETRTKGAEDFCIFSNAVRFRQIVT